MQPRMLDIEMKCDDLAQHLVGSTANASEPGVPVHPLQRVGIGETAGAEYLEYLVDGRAAGTRRDEFGRRDLMVPEEGAADRFAGPVEQCRGCLYVGPAIGKPVPQCLVIEKPLAEVAIAAQNPLNIALDIQTVKDLKAVWPSVKQFLGSLGVKF